MAESGYGMPSYLPHSAKDLDTGQRQSAATAKVQSRELKTS
jgi:hypothetical protein